MCGYIITALLVYIVIRDARAIAEFLVSLPARVQRLRGR